jgi:hypothetical protein
MIQIDSAMGTKALARLAAKNLNRDLQENLLIDDGIKVNDIILIIDKIEVIAIQFHLFLGFLVTRDQGVFEIAPHGERRVFKAPAACGIHGGFHGSLQIERFPHLFDQTGHIRLFQDENGFILFRENGLEPASILGKLEGQSLLRDLADGNLHRRLKIRY